MRDDPLRHLPVMGKQIQGQRSGMIIDIPDDLFNEVEGSSGSRHPGKTDKIRTSSIRHFLFWVDIVIPPWL